MSSQNTKALSDEKTQSQVSHYVVSHVNFPNDMDQFIIIIIIAKFLKTSNRVKRRVWGDRE